MQFYDYFSMLRNPSPHIHQLKVLFIAEGNCPNAYAYAFDESSGTALWTCDSGLNADYTLTFCPYVLVLC